MADPIKALCATSLAVVVTTQAMADLLIANSKEVTALHETLKQHDKGFEKAYEHERKEVDSTSRLVPAVARLQDTLAELLQSLADIQQLLPEK